MARTSSPVAAYFAALPADQRRALQQLQRTIRRLVPDAEEAIRYGIVTFRRSRPLVGLGASAKHCAFYLMSTATLAAHRAAVRGLDTSAGTIRFQPGAPLADALVRTLVLARLAENDALPPPGSPSGGSPKAGQRAKRART